jgi:hypothetical protein
MIKIFCDYASGEEAKGTPTRKIDHHTHRSPNYSMLAKSKKYAISEALQVAKFLATIPPTN